MNDNRKVRTWSLVALGAAARPSVRGGRAQPNSSNQRRVAGTGSAGYYGSRASRAIRARPARLPARRPARLPAPGQPASARPAGLRRGQPGPPGYPPAIRSPASPRPAAHARPGQPAPSGSAAPPLAPTDPEQPPGHPRRASRAPSRDRRRPAAAAAPATSPTRASSCYALRVAPGMQPEGDELKQNLQQGPARRDDGHAAGGQVLHARRLLGARRGGDVDLNLLAPPLYMTLAGQDLTHNNTPVIGGVAEPDVPRHRVPAAVQARRRRATRARASSRCSSTRRTSDGALRPNDSDRSTVLPPMTKTTAQLLVLSRSGRAACPPSPALACGGSAAKPAETAAAASDDVRAARADARRDDVGAAPADSASAAHDRGTLAARAGAHDRQRADPEDLRRGELRAGGDAQAERRDRRRSPRQGHRATPPRSSPPGCSRTARWRWAA